MRIVCCVVVGLVAAVSLGRPALAAGTVCAPDRAQHDAAAADRSLRAGRYRDAAAQYLASARLAQGCDLPRDRFVGAHALAAAGAALALSGEELRALDLLQGAQALLGRLDGEGTLGRAVRDDRALVTTVITAIERLAQASM